MQKLERQDLLRVMFFPGYYKRLEEMVAYDLRTPESARGEFANDFGRGFRGTRNVFELETSGEVLGRQAAAIVNFGKGMIGVTSFNNSRSEWKQGNYGTSVVHGMAAIGEAGSALLSFGLAGMARQSGKIAAVDSLAANGASKAIELSPGAVLRQKYGNLSAEERQALIRQKVETNAEYWVRKFEGDLNSNNPGLNAHFVDKHGPDIPLRPNLEQRSIDGTHPRAGSTPGAPRPQTSSQFQDWRTRMEVFNEATTREARGLPKYSFFDAQGNPSVVGRNSAGVGWGFTPNRTSPLAPTFNPKLDGWIIRFDSNLGVPFTGLQQDKRIIMLLKHPNSNVDFSVTPAYFLGDFDVYDREETLGARLEEFDPNNDEQLQVVLEEYFFRGARATGLSAEHKAELVRVLEDALENSNFDFDSLVAHERDPDDYFTLPYTWDIKRPKEFFRKVHRLAVKFWRNDLGEIGLNT